MRVNPKLVSLPLIAAVMLSCLTSWAQDTPDWQSLAATYAYDSTLPLEAQWDKELKPDGQLVRVRFASLNDQTVPAVVGLPSASTFGEGPYPAVVFGHGLGGSKDDDAYRMAAMLLLQNGFATIVIDYPEHGERASGALGVLGQPTTIGPNQTAQMIQRVAEGTVQTVLDQRRAVDLLQSLDSVDPDRIGYAGVSLGAILGAVLLGVEDRLACGALIVGGADWESLLSRSTLVKQAVDAGVLDPKELAQKLAASDPKYFAPHISCPTLLLFGGQDDVVPYDPCGKLLAELTPEPKTVHVYEGAGHLLETGGAMFDAVSRLTAFLGEHLKPKD